MALSRKFRTYGGVKEEKGGGSASEEVWPALLDDKVEEEKVESVGQREEEMHTERGDLPTKFEELPLSEEVRKAIDELGFAEPTLIQAAAIPALVEGDDVMGQARTGTGKTAAFGLPALMKADPEADFIQALVLCPTRELCQQVTKELDKFSKYSGHDVVAIYGGQPVKTQLDALASKKPQLIVGTPGRVIDLTRRGNLDLSRVLYAVLDEADEMLDMGFIDDIRFILQQTPRTRQTALFSATFPPTIRRLARGSMDNPRVIHTVGKRLTVESVVQIFYEVEERRKMRLLTILLDLEEIDRALVFCRTKWETQMLGDGLQARGYEVRVIHGDLPQSTRTKVMEDFRAGKLDVLVATDVAARGLDITGVTHVINYHLPQDPEVYVHRIGRTARMGKDGLAISLVDPRDYHELVRIQEKADVHIEQRDPPDVEAVTANRRIKVAKAVAEHIDAGELEAYMPAADALIEASGDARAALAYFLSKEFERNHTGLRESTGDEFGDTGARHGNVRLHINVGKEHELDEDGLRKALAEVTELAAEDWRELDLKGDISFVEVPADKAHRALHELEGKEIAGVTLAPSPARGRRRRDDRGDRGGRGRDRDRGGRGRGDRDRGERGGRRDGRGRGRDEGDRPRRKRRSRDDEDRKPVAFEPKKKSEAPEGGPEGERKAGDGDGPRKRRRRRRRRGPRGEGGEGARAEGGQGGGGEGASSGAPAPAPTSGGDGGGE